LGSHIVMCMPRHRRRRVRGRFGLPDGHRSAALEGQHRDREPQEQSEEQTRHASMVSHSGACIKAPRRMRIPVHAHAPSRGAGAWAALQPCGGVAGSNLC
jgi:hypothetical protein